MLKKQKKQEAVNELSAKMDTVVKNMTSTEGQLKELEKQALYLQQLAEKEEQEKEKVAQEAVCSKTSSRGSNTTSDSARTA